MKLHLLPSFELSEQRFNEIFNLMNQYPGIAEFIKGSTAIHFGAIENPSELTWTKIWQQCDLYREQHKLQDDEAVILLTDIPNDQNWFSSGLVDGNRNFFVHTSHWEQFIESSSVYPIASELALIILAIGGFTDLDELEAIAHLEPKGCMFDFCGRKEQIRIRLRTADVCPDCREYLKRKNVEPAILRQAFAIIEGVRGQMLFRERLDILNEPSPVFVDGITRSIHFTGIGNLKIKLDPKHLTVYHFFLKHEEGVAYRNMKEHVKELQQIYTKYADVDILEGIPDEINILVRTENNNLSTIVSDINKALRSAIDERIVSQYLIMGPNGRRKKVMLNRKLVSYSGYLETIKSIHSNPENFNYSRKNDSPVTSL